MIGHFSWGLQTLIEKARPGPARVALRILYAILPDLENFNYKTDAVYGLKILPQYYAVSALYGLTYTLFILVLAVLIFKKRDFV